MKIFNLQDKPHAPWFGIKLIIKDCLIHRNSYIFSRNNTLNEREILMLLL